MQRHQLEHVLRAAGSIAECDEFIVVGSQAILALDRPLPEALLRSAEVDLYPRGAPERSDLIDGTIGELSPFHQTFGYYAHGIGPETATLASGWESRLLEVCNENTRGVKGWCLHPLDLAYSKLAAGRAKDLDFVQTLLQAQIIESESLARLIQGSRTEEELLSVLESRLRILRSRLSKSADD